MKHQKLIRNPKIAIIGAGGTGSQVITGIARLVYALREIHGTHIEVSVYDPDSVSTANVGRQLFSPSDVGQNKAQIIVQRINAYFGYAWTAYSESYRGNELDYTTNIIVSCVDSRAARAAIYDGLKHHQKYWMDLGNTNHSGQVILGNTDYSTSSWRKRQKYCLLPTVADLFPEIIDDSITESDDIPSCSLAHALEKQDLMVNQTVATHAVELLWQLLRHGELSHHGVFFNTQRFSSQPLPIDPDNWKRLLKSAKKYRALAKAA